MNGLAFFLEFSTPFGRHECLNTRVKLELIFNYGGPWIEYIVLGLSQKHLWVTTSAFA